MPNVIPELQYQALAEVLPLPTIVYSQAASMPVFEWRLQYQALSTTIPRLLPTPNITGTWASLELKDIFLASGRSFNVATSGEIGLNELTTALIGEIGVSEKPAPATIFGGSISVSQI